MNFSYYEISTGKRCIATNIMAIHLFSGISYNKVYGWFKDGNTIHIDDDVICFCSDAIKGRQRLSKKDLESKVSNKPDGPVPQKNWTDQTGPGCPIGPPGDEGPPGLPTRETKQPGSRNMSEFDDFFKEV